MSEQNEVYVMVFDHFESADRALRELQQWVSAGEIRLEDAAAIRKNTHGKVTLLQTKDWSEDEAAIGGGVVGLLLGTLIGGPISGALFGIGLGALYARLTDFGIEDDLMRNFGEQMLADHSAIAILTTSTEADKAAAKLGEYGGMLLHSALSVEAQQALSAALRSGQPVPEADIEAPTSAAD
ncbi:MAG: DUF1269 domain-containing protein [Anaerolineae bacterium]|nr:DUF1269 domain-containing protein [Anaerolineae bacterium]